MGAPARTSRSRRRASWRLSGATPRPWWRPEPKAQATISSAFSRRLARPTATRSPARRRSASCCKCCSRGTRRRRSSWQTAFAACLRIVSRFLTSKLRLKVNEAKSAVARPEERKFLGFSISNDGSERRIAPKALDKFKERIRELTSRIRGLSLAQIIEELTPYLIGWRGYFGFCQTPRVLTNLEAWIRRRLRSYLWRQWGNGHNRFKELRRRGVPKFGAAVAAGSPTGFWRMSGHPAVQAALRNHYFDSLGLPRLYVPVRLNLVEPPWYATRMPGGVGGAAP